jgi:putative ABC transport system permease protein
LTESNVRNLFGDINPIGKTVELEEIQYEVTGVIQDVKNAHFDIDGFISMATIEKRYPDRNLNVAAGNSWFLSATYLLLNENVDHKKVENKINKVLAEINEGNLFDIIFKGFRLRQLKDLYFNGSSTNMQYGKQGNLTLVHSFIFVAVFILVLACVNYINLTTARATLRNKEVAMKKVMGSDKALLRYQFIAESILITLISFVVALTLVQGLIAPFNRLALVDINLVEFNKPIVWVLTILGILLIGSISGLYPALYLASTKSISLIKGETTKGYKGSIIRTALLTFQFSISILLIIATITSIRQLEYAMTMDLGFNQEQIIRTRLPADPEAKYSKETIKGRLLQDPNILKVAFTIFEGIGSQAVTGISVEIDGEERSPTYIPIDPDFFNLMEIDIIKGRNFSWDRESEMNDPSLFGSNIVFGVILNETAAREFDIDSPIGKIISLNYGEIQIRYEIIGIARDFHSQSIHHEIEPVLFPWGRWNRIMMLKISSDNITATLNFIKDEWKKVYGSVPFTYAFVDEAFDQQYKSDEQGTKIIGYFSILAIIIACMGLFALSSFMAVRRTKEIGIRKAMGATSQGIFLLLAKEFVKWVLISVIIASPVALIIMKKWLEGFAYKINLRVDIFILAAVVAIAIALLTVTWQSLKTALANPVEALRYE